VRKFGDQEERGFGAQHLLQVAEFKGLVGTDTDEDGTTTYTVNYLGMLPPTIAVVRKLIDENDSLRAQLAAVAARVSKIEASVNP